MVSTDVREGMGLFERYGVELVGLIMFAIVSWTGYTTYQNALLLVELKATMDVSANNFVRVDDRLSEALAEIKHHERRISRIEDTRWAESDQRSFKEWIQEELSKKVDK